MKKQKVRDISKQKCYNDFKHFISMIHVLMAVAMLSLSANMCRS
jgi:hypothetical protein